MKKLLALLLGILMLCSLVSAQDMVKAGSKSLNFTFGGLGTFGLNGTGPNPGGLVTAGLGVSYFLSSDAAVRAGLQVGIMSTSTPTNLTTGGTDGSSSGMAVGLALDYLMYMNSVGKVRPYMGAGVNFSMVSATNEPVDKTPYDKRIGGTPTTFGVAGILGAEFFIYPEISLSAEYNLNLVSMTSTSDTEVTVGATTTTTKNGSSTQILGFGAGGATIHFYF